jgi:hypothetical protein
LASGSFAAGVRKLLKNQHGSHQDSVRPFGKSGILFREEGGKAKQIGSRNVAKPTRPRAL